MRRTSLAAAACACLFLTACSDDSAGPGPEGSFSAVPAAEADHARTLAVYTAVIRELVTVDSTNGATTSPYKRIWVVDHAVLNAAQTIGEDQPGDAFSDALKADLKAALTDLPPLEFVPDPTAARTAGESGFAVRGHGLIITVGPIEKHGSRVHVGHETWCGFSCAEWFTYVLQQRDGTWAVTGETGEHAIT